MSEALINPINVRAWLNKHHPKQLALLDTFEMELRLGRLSTSSKTKGKSGGSSLPSSGGGSDKHDETKNYGGVKAIDRRQVTTRTVGLLRNLIGNTKWKNAAQLMGLLRGIGKELHAAGGAKEPAIANIVRRIMCAVRDEVATAEAAEAQAQAAAQKGKSKSSTSSSSQDPSSSSMEPIAEHSAVASNVNVNVNVNVSAAPPTSTTRMSLTSMLWAHPQHLTTSGTSTRAKRSDSFSSVDSSSERDRDPLALSDENFPPSFYVSRPYFRAAVMEAIGEIINDLEDLHKNIDEQAYTHIHTGEVILTYSRSKTVESFLKAAAKKRKFQVIVCEGAPHFGGHRMAASLSDAGIDTTVIHDAAAFAIMARVNKVLLPAHAVMANGGLIAPSGSHMVALAAAHNSVPIVCLTGMFKLCPMYPHEGQDTLQDLVSPSSVVNFAELNDQRIMARVEFVNPVHDYIPPQLINLYLTNIGAFQPSYIYRLLAEYYHSDDWESFE